MRRTIFNTIVVFSICILALLTLSCSAARLKTRQPVQVKAAVFEMAHHQDKQGLEQWQLFRFFCGGSQQRSFNDDFSTLPLQYSIGSASAIPFYHLYISAKPRYQLKQYLSCIAPFFSFW
ncbi:MAG: hypothetical protein QM731_10865 [Chitinophagaceae bacterium]